MTKKHCFVAQVGDAIEKLAAALLAVQHDYQEIISLRQQLDAANTWINKYREKTTSLRQQLAKTQAQSTRRLEGLCKCGIEKDQLRQQLAAKQAEVDALMLEYCPSEMSQEQLEEWGRNQRPAKEQ